MTLRMLSGVGGLLAEKAELLKKSYVGGGRDVAAFRNAEFAEPVTQSLKRRCKMLTWKSSPGGTKQETSSGNQKLMVKTTR